MPEIASIEANKSKNLANLKLIEWIGRYVGVQLVRPQSALDAPFLYTLVEPLNLDIARSLCSNHFVPSRKLIIFVMLFVHRRSRFDN